MKLYYYKGACSLVVRIVLNEIGLNFESEAVNLKTKVTATGEDFLKINPKGSIPVLQLDNNETLTENSVILQYLAENSKSTQLLPQLGDSKRYRVLEWLNYVTTELHKSFGPMFNPTIPQEFKKKIFLPAIKLKFKYVNNQLQEKQYLLGDHFTLPDAYLYVMLLWAAYIKLDLTEYNALVTYLATLNNRKSIMKSLQEEKQQ